MIKILGFEIVVCVLLDVVKCWILTQLVG